MKMRTSRVRIYSAGAPAPTAFHRAPVARPLPVSRPARPPLVKRPVRLPPGGSEAGFTFVEVLISILVVALLSGVVTEVVIQVDRLQRKTRQVAQARGHLRTMVCRIELGGAPAIEPGELDRTGWRIDRKTVDDDPFGSWTRWSVSPLRHDDAVYGIWIPAPPRPL